MIKVVTDSTADISTEEARGLDVTVVPLYVRIGERFLRDGIDISKEEFYQKLEEGTLCTTSQPSPDDFIAAYKPILDKGDEIISIHISEQLSGTINSANLAKEELRTDRVTIIDSKVVTIPLLYKVRKVCELIKNGFDREKIKEELEEFHKRVNGYFVPMDINYLIRGGRIGHLQSIVTTLLKLQFILYLKDGRIELLKIARTKSSAVKGMVEVFKDTIRKKGGLEQVDIICGTNKEEEEEFRQMIEKETGLSVRKYSIGPVLSNHMGPRYLGIPFITKGG